MDTFQFEQVPTESLTTSAQVRKHFDEPSLVGLAMSLKETGMLQPIVARRSADRLEIVFGERRWRAAKKAGLATVPVLVLDGCDNEATTLIAQLSENLQRAQLSPLEAAESIFRLMKLTGENATVTARRLGTSNASVTRLLSLLSLPEEVQREVGNGNIVASTAYALARIDDPAKQSELAKQAVNGKLTRDAASEEAKNPRNSLEPKPRMSVSRAVAKLSEGQIVTMSGGELTLDVFVSSLVELVSRARKAQRRGVDLSTFLKGLKSESQKDLPT